MHNSMLRTLPEILNLLKSNQYPIVVNLDLVKQGFGVIVGFWYVCLFKNPVK